MAAIARSAMTVGGERDQEDDELSRKYLIDDEDSELMLLTLPPPLPDFLRQFPSLL